MSDDDLVDCCPACGHADFKPRKHNGIGRPPADDKQYRCKRCTHTFDEPDRAPPKMGGNAPRLLADDDQREQVLEALESEVEAL